MYCTGFRQIVIQKVGGGGEGEGEGEGRGRGGGEGGGGYVYRKHVMESWSTQIQSNCWACSSN